MLDRRLLAALLVAALPLAARAAGWPALPAPRGDDLAAVRLEQLAAELARDRGGPRGIALLAEADALAEELPDLARLAGIYARTAEDRAADPEVRALARFRLAGVELARGNLQRRDAQLRRLGFLTRWQVIGPFDDEGRRGFDARYAPEERVDLGAAAPGKVREVRWRPLPDDAIAAGFVNLGAAVRPSREAVAYALAVVDAPRDEQVTLWLGASGAAKVWVNGALALSDRASHPARLDQRGATVTLRRGANRILVKLCHQSGRMGFYLRLADARGDGRQLAVADWAAPLQAAGPAPAPVEDAVARLEARARGLRGRAAAEARLDLARALAERLPYEAEERRAAREAAAAAAAAPAWVEAQRVAARLADDHQGRRARLEAALAAAPGDARALVMLAEEELDQDRPHAAARLLVRAVEAAPGWAAPRIALVRALERVGLEARAARLAAATADAFPTVPGAVRAAARAARQLGRLDEAAQRHRTLLALRLDDAEARGALAQLLADRGDVAGAAALHREALRLDPSDGWQRLRLGDLLAANGEPEQAEAAYAAALALAPDEPDGWERRGRARLAAGRTRDAQADLARALELAPQDPALKELVRSLEPAQERFERPYLADAVALARAAPAPAPEDDAQVLSEVKVTRVLPSGQSATFVQVIARAITLRGAEQLRRHVLSWAPDRQEVRVERARVLKPDGRVIETHEERESSASEPWYRLYYDTVTRTLSFPALAPGDVLEVAWRVEDVGRENLLSDYFGDLDFVDGTTRKLRYDRVLLVPAGRELHANRPEGVKHAVRPLPGGVVEHRFTARDTPRIQGEPGMPGWSEVARHVHVSTYASWEQVNRFYWGLVREQLRPDAEIRAVAEGLAREVLRARPAPAAPRQARVEPASAPTGEGGPIVVPAGGWDPETQRALVRAVYGFVVTQTRYVGLEFGIHGFKPYRVEQVLRRRFGDCKDKASLMHALLESIGIESRLVLLRMRRLGRIPEAPASLAVFNHAILYVPGLDLWLDGTAAYSGSGELPAEDRGATVLVVNPDGPPRFGTIPDAAPGENVNERRLEVRLAEDGAARVAGSWTVTGAEAPGFRRLFQADGERAKNLERLLAGRLPGLRVEELSVGDLARLEEPVALRFAAEVPRYAHPDAGGLRLAPLADARLAPEWASLSTRALPLDLGSPGTQRVAVRVALPAGWRAAELPEDAHAEGPFGRFTVRWRAEAGALAAELEVVRAVSRVAPGDYPAFRAWVSDLDRALARRLRLEPALLRGAEASR